MTNPNNNYYSHNIRNYLNNNHVNLNSNSNNREFWNNNNKRINKIKISLVTQIETIITEVVIVITII